MCVFVYITHVSHMYVHIVSPLSLLMHTWYHVGSPPPGSVRILPSCFPALPRVVRISSILAVPVGVWPVICICLVIRKSL